MQITLNDNEVEVLDNYLTRKVMRLEESGLADSRCCLAMTSILAKLYRGRNNENR